jgi:hypothetical protein
LIGAGKRNRVCCALRVQCDAAIGLRRGESHVAIQLMLFWRVRVVVEETSAWWVAGFVPDRLFEGHPIHCRFERFWSTLKLTGFQTSDRYERPRENVTTRMEPVLGQRGCLVENPRCARPIIR